MSYTEDAEKTKSGFSPSAKSPSEGETRASGNTGTISSANPVADAKTGQSVTRAAMAAIAGACRRPEDTASGIAPKPRTEEDRILKEALERSREDCNALISRQNELIEKLTEREDWTLENMRKTIYKRLEEFTTASNDNFDALKETLTSFEKDLKKETDDSMAELKTSAENATAGLASKVEEVSALYQKILGTCLAELKETKAELAKAMREEPLRKKETADLLRKSIEKTADDLTEFYKSKLAGSVSSLSGAIKKAKESAEDIGRGGRRGMRLYRVMLVLNPVLLFAACVISIVGIFV